jgi:hypothetical protein
MNYAERLAKKANLRDQLHQAVKNMEQAAAQQLEIQKVGNIQINNTPKLMEQSVNSISVPAHKAIQEQHLQQLRKQESELKQKIDQLNKQKQSFRVFKNFEEIKNINIENLQNGKILKVIQKQISEIKIQKDSGHAGTCTHHFNQIGKVENNKFQSTNIKYKKVNIPDKTIKNIKQILAYTNKNRTQKQLKQIKGFVINYNQESNTAEVQKDDSFTKYEITQDQVQIKPSGELHISSNEIELKIHKPIPKEIRQFQNKINIINKQLKVFNNQNKFGKQENLHMKKVENCLENRITELQEKKNELKQQTQNIKANKNQIVNNMRNRARKIYNNKIRKAEKLIGKYQKARYGLAVKYANFNQKKNQFYNKRENTYKVINHYKYQNSSLFQRIKDQNAYIQYKNREYQNRNNLLNANNLDNAINSNEVGLNFKTNEQLSTVNPRMSRLHNNQ